MSKSHAATVSAEIVNVTPAQAREWLESNQVNRNLRQGAMLAYRRDMEEGRWVLTAEPIHFSRTGRLLNGQHRLTALAGSTGVKSVELMVVTGLPDQAQILMDQGASRKASDALIIAEGHVKNSTLAGSISRWYRLVPQMGPDLNPVALRGQTSTAELVETFRNNPDIAQAAERAAYFRKHVPGSATAIGYTWLHLNRVDSEATAEYFAGMIDMEWSWPSDPRKAAYRRLQIMQRDPDMKASRDTGVMVASVLTRAWNAWRKEESMDTIMTRSRSGIVLPVTPI